ncbi:MAG: hypothetical protein ACQEQF_07415 [Bacillota bacterium]
MSGVGALTVILIVFAIGDIFSAKTNALLSMLFVSSLIFLVAFWLGLPTSIFEDAALIKLGGVLVAFLITHMGTLMNIDELKEQWKTVLIALAAVVGVGIFVLLLASIIVGKDTAIVAAPPISGGIVAALIMSEEASALGMDNMAVLATLLVVIQGFIGYPLTSYLLNREAQDVVDNLEDKKELTQSDVEKEIKVEGAKEKDKPAYQIIPPLPENLQTSFILLAKLGIMAFISVQLAALTGGIIHKFVMALIVGIFAREIGFLEEGIMEKANAFGLGMVALLAVVMNNLTKATPELVLELLLPIVVTLAAGSIGIAILSGLISKLLGFSAKMGMSIGFSALYGFPGTYIISHEAAEGVSENEKEKEAILEHILPKMLVAGFVTVTISSVVLAGIFVNFLG